MENRKELSEKSKKLISKQFKSDILNASTGYYKKEKIFPITPKPNESKQKYKEFIPKYKEIKPHEMRISNLLSDQQKHNNLIMNNLKIIQTKRNPEIENKRKREKTIKDNCYDNKGNFSAKKRYILEFYGLENINKTPYNRSTSESIKERRFHNRSLFIQRIRKCLDIYNEMIDSYIEKYSTINNNANYNGDNNINDFENNSINISYNDLNHNGFNGIINNRNKLSKISRNKNHNRYNNLSLNLNENFNNTYNFEINKENNHNRVKTDINYTNRDTYKNNKNFNNKDNQKENEKNNLQKYYHPKDITKVFYTQINKPVKSDRINKNERDNEEKEYFNLQIKNIDSLKDLPDKKKIKEIFYKNGLHIYDLNEDGMNILSREKKMEAKLRKNKKDEDFDRNYRKATKELKKLNIVIDKREILSDKGFESKVVRKKRKGTPGRVLYNNKQNKDENTRLNTGFGYKRDKNILPQKNQNYKNYYNYRMTYFNHNKK